MMVTYQFVCQDCGMLTEKNFELGEAPSSVPCEEEDCSGVAMKVIATPNILIKNPVSEARRGRGKGR